MSWQPYNKGRSLGKRGSEHGWIRLDEEHEEGSRITLEVGCSIGPYAITCGIYGWMVHTRHFSSWEVANDEYELMKVSLATILKIIPNTTNLDHDERIDKALDAVAEFIENFP
jgi:hypothetical protein